MARQLVTRPFLGYNITNLLKEEIRMIMLDIDRDTWYRLIEAVELEWLSLSRVFSRHYINDV